MTRRVLVTLLALMLVVCSTGAPAAAQALQDSPDPANLVQPFLQPTPPDAEIAAVLATATQITAGGSHTCALTSAGGVKCWGLNHNGQLGDGTTTDRLAPVEVTGLTSGVIAVAAGMYHTCAVTTGGGLKCWGRNDFGQLAAGRWTWAETTPVDVIGLGTTVTAVTLGEVHTCALTSAGGVKCWGNNTWGQLGDGTKDYRYTPLDVIGLASGATAVVAGGLHTCALTNDGVKCWGDNENGQLGDGTKTERHEPVDVSGLASGADALTGGGRHTCALGAGGGVKCWGGNHWGQLGDDTTTDRTEPVDVTGLGSGMTAVASGGSHTCALDSAGRLKCWGFDMSGQVGDGLPTFSRPVPVAVNGLGSAATAVAAGGGHTCALTRSGGIRCWGSNSSGQLGDGTTSWRSIPGDVSGLASGVTAVAAGFGHTCALTGPSDRASGVECWGANYYGQLGDGTLTNRFMPAQPVGLAGGAIAVAVGDSHACALTSGGEVRCWGSNDDGQLGDGTTTTRTTPVDVSGLPSGVTAVAAGVGRTCALTSAGGVKCWGNNGQGALGDGTSTNRSTPVDVIGLTSGVTMVTSGYSHTCALTSGGGVKCWGSAVRLGVPPWPPPAGPVDVSGLGSGVTAVTAGMEHTCALTSGGGVQCWGDNSSGQLGDGTQETRYAPVGVTGLTSGVIAVAAGGSHTCALTSGGRVKCWGRNNLGQLGDGTTIDRAAPVEVSGLAGGVIALTAGGGHTCAVTSGGSVKCWGDGASGQAGFNPGWAPVNVVGYEVPLARVGYLPMVFR